jgi:phosphoribosylamine--glycine ligase
VLAAGGYPGAYGKGDVISGLDEAAEVENVVVFHAGTALRGDDVVTSGGRVLTVTAIGKDIDEAAERAYRAADRITFAGRQMRRDIGYRARKHA